MARIINSAALKRVIRKAQTVGGKSKTMRTVQQFLIALIDEIGSSKEEELKEAERIFIERRLDLGDVHNLMLHYIDRDESEDHIYIMLKINRANQKAEAEGKEELKVADVLTCILDEPNWLIKKLLDGERAEEHQEPEEEPDRSDILAAEIEAALRGEAAPSEEEEIELIDEDFEEEEDFPEDFEEDFSDDFEEEEEEEEASAASFDVKAEMGSLVSDMKRIRAELKQHIFGQDKAIDIFVSGFFQASLLSMIDKSRVRPRATFLFAGPPGVGKPFLAQKSAEVLQMPFARFDMSEYCDKEAALEFCGSDAVYRNSKGGNFTTWLKKNPKSIILLDEIEKAHISIIHLFLQILDAGRIRDNKSDEELSLKDTILIFTTNAGKQLYNEGEDRDLSSLSRKVIINALEKDVNPATKVPYFPAAICSRFASGNVVMFNHIAAHDLRTLAEKEILRHVGNLRKESGIEMELDERVYTALLLSEGVRADARTTKSRAEAFFNDELYELFRLISADKVKTGVEAIEKIKVCVDLEQSDEEICALFEAKGKKNILVVASDALIARCKAKTDAFEFFGAQSCRAAIEAVQSKEIDVILLDVQYGVAKGGQASLNIEDMASPAREFFAFLREQKSEIPVYLVGDGENELHEEEVVSFTRQGVRGMLLVSEGSDDFAARLQEIGSILHQQASMLQLARENKLLSFETAQTVSEDGSVARIRLFDFKTMVAVDSEDLKSVLSAVSIPKVRFSDVIGAKDAKQELQYFVEYLKNPKKYLGTGVKAPKGLLLYGPPGTGKTMLAKAMAKEAGVTYIAAEGNQFLKRYIGEGSEKVHELFRTARKYAPSILFIDEIDAIARVRTGAGGGTGEVEGTLTAFLAEMDGFVSDPSKPVFVLAATNFDVEPGRSKSLDPALLRRFDRRVLIDLPDQEERTQYLRMKISKNAALAISEAQIEQLSLRSFGMSLAELDSIMELALRSAIRKGSTKVTDEIMEDAFELFNNGETKQWDPSRLERTARHEAGHALLCWLAGQTPSYITVVARADHGGYVQPAAQEKKGTFSKPELLAQIRFALGGRAAELVYYGEEEGQTTGASADLFNATRTAQDMVCSLGMDEEFGLAVVQGEGLSREARAVVNRILKEQLEQAKMLIEQNREKIDALVEVLKVRNHLNGAELEKVLSEA